MWDRIKTFVTQHPYGTAAIVFGVGLVVILYYSGRKTVGGNDMAAYYAAASAATASGNQLQMAQVAATAQSNQVTQAAAVALADSNNQLEAYKAGIAGQTDIEKIRADAARDITTITGNVQQNLSTATIRQNEFSSLVTANTLQQLTSMLKGYGVSVGNLSPTSSFTS